MTCPVLRYCYIYRVKRGALAICPCHHATPADVREAHGAKAEEIAAILEDDCVYPVVFLREPGAGKKSPRRPFVVLRDEDHRFPEILHPAPEVTPP